MDTGWDTYDKEREYKDALNILCWKLLEMNNYNDREIIALLKEKNPNMSYTTISEFYPRWELFIKEILDKELNINQDKTIFYE